jgi:hypothetical protein
MSSLTEYLLALVALILIYVSGLAVLHWTRPRELSRSTPLGNQRHSQ